MARIVISPEAENDLNEIYVFLGRHSLTAAERFLVATQRAFEKLVTLPELAGHCESRHRALADLRVWPIPGFRKYLIFYRVISNGIEIRRVLHGARDLESLFGIGQ
jgi:toxin ParE1/3/4